ncbi:MAG: bacteriohopanetetrol glucosamine biosynthesis glycosyltransferase HpnI [Bradyrhizobium sp.]
MIIWTAYICLAAATFGCLYMAFACVAALRFGRSDRAAPATPVAVSVLVPLCGHEPGLYARLRALCEQDYGAPVQILCAIHGPDDPALAVVKQVAADMPGATMEWQTDARVHGRNLKMSNLMNIVGRAQHDIIVMIDSDIMVGRDHLARVVGELQQPGVGAVTCLYYGVAGGGLWSRLSAMNVNLQFLPSVIVGVATRLAQPCFGSTVALTRAMLDRIGGLQRFVDQLWDDYAIGQAVRETGTHVAVSSITVGHVCAESTGREFFDYQLRNGRTIGSIDPVGYAGAVIIHPFALSLLALALDPGQPAFAIALVAIVSRLALTACMQRRFGLRSNYWLVPVHDIAAFAIYLMSFFGGTVMWRGQRYSFQSDGSLLQPSQ